LMKLSGFYTISYRIFFTLAATILAGCLVAKGMTEIESGPYPLVYQDDSTARFSNPDDTVFLEVRRVKASKPLENLAIHYTALFPGGEIIRPGDSEEYLKINGKNAYKVIFKPNYIRKRKRIQTDQPGSSDKPEAGWSVETIEDPVTGKLVSIMKGPVIQQQRLLYLIRGEDYLYYVFLRTDGESIESAKKKFETFVREGIKYR
jgi:hypothetical protein